MATQGADAQTRGQDFVEGVRKSSHFHIIMADLLIKAGGIFFYLFCNWFSKNFIINFVVITVLMAADFWFTKNVTGRLLVGLRWWSEPSHDGNQSTWRFENLCLVQNAARQVSAIDTTWFWGGLLITLGVWIVFAILEVTQLEYLLLCILGIAFSGSNLLGYYHCRRWGNKELAAMQGGGFAAAIGGVTSTVASGFMNVLNRV